MEPENWKHQHPSVFLTVTSTIAEPITILNLNVDLILDRQI